VNAIGLAERQNMGKILWMDTETTGLTGIECPGCGYQNAMIQFAGIIDIDGKVMAELSFAVRPFNRAKVEKVAMEVNGKSVQQIVRYPAAGIGLGELKKHMGRFVNKYDPADKFVPAGYRVDFDTDFVRTAFEKAGDKYFGSWFFNCSLDVRSIVSLAILKKNLRLANWKLGTVCEAYGVQLTDAHDALADVRACRELYYRIVEEL